MESRRATASRHRRDREKNLSLPLEVLDDRIEVKSI